MNKGTRHLQDYTKLVTISGMEHTQFSNCIKLYQGFSSSLGLETAHLVPRDTRGSWESLFCFVSSIFVSLSATSDLHHGVSIKMASHHVIICA
ncbi:hypothetical protein RRG08_021631 [Elysia crispata]|uniref:Uncharacterized protein n=1 Tax=Elysia crispata TaxID=231223 RepID=A0AAE0XE94_9GAST|nr:hypothetical protein RRG08_021631 [Elysia crispata]